MQRASVCALFKCPFCEIDLPVRKRKKKKKEKMQIEQKKEELAFDDGLELSFSPNIGRESGCVHVRKQIPQWLVGSSDGLAQEFLEGLVRSSNVETAVDGQAIHWLRPHEGETNFEKKKTT
jgi:hypothetical protein